MRQLDAIARALRIVDDNVGHGLTGLRIQSMVCRSFERDDIREGYGFDLRELITARIRSWLVEQNPSCELLCLIEPV